MADLVLTYVGRLFNWHAIRDDSFRSPIVRGMARTNGKERARSRILNDDELRAAWKAAGETTGPFGPFVKFVLLTATRRHEAGHARRSEIVNGVWTIPAARYKTKIDHVIPLSGAALALLAELPQIGNCDFYFTNDGRKPIR
ncbi:MAG: integrase, partial [Xanthobacteraceae bacterium]